MIRSGKLYEGSGRNSCVLECPKNTELNEKNICSSCEPNCKKNCSGGVIDSIEKAREYTGCTRITGYLKIQIRGKGGAKGILVQELKDCLDKVEQIDDYLIVTYTYAIYTLSFLEKLKFIGGIHLFENK